MIKQVSARATLDTATRIVLGVPADTLRQERQESASRQLTVLMVQLIPLLAQVTDHATSRLGCARVMLGIEELRVKRARLDMNMCQEQPSVTLS
jgi:hypothetical protein